MCRMRLCYVIFAWLFSQHLQAENMQLFNSQKCRQDGFFTGHYGISINVADRQSTPLVNDVALAADRLAHAINAPIFPSLTDVPPVEGLMLSHVSFKLPSALVNRYYFTPYFYGIKSVPITMTEVGLQNRFDSQAGRCVAETAYRTFTTSVASGDGSYESLEKCESARISAKFLNSLRKNTFYTACVKGAAKEDKGFGIVAVTVTDSGNKLVKH